MCIIAAKPANTPMPDLETLENMWFGNPDGAGFMWAQDGFVQIRKGFMTFKDLSEELASVGKTVDLNAVPVIMHFRITTHGGTCPENTHPFPVTDSIKMLRLTHNRARVGVAHNGIIPIKPRNGISDTMEYIATQLAPLSKALPKWYNDKNALQLVRNGIKSKLAVLTGDGQIVTIGEFNTCDGISYSNYSYLGFSRKGRLIDNYTFTTGGTDETEDTPKAGKVKSMYTPVRRPLMDVTATDLGAYVKCPKTGECYEGVDYSIDSTGHVYIYDPDWDCFRRVKDFIALTSNGTALHFEYKKATYEYTGLDLD